MLEVAARTLESSCVGVSGDDGRGRYGRGDGREKRWEHGDGDGGLGWVG